MCEKFDLLYSVLEGKKREMSQKVTAEQEEKVNYIRDLTKKYSDHLEEGCKIVEMGIQTMEEPEMALFLQVRNTVCNFNVQLSVFNNQFFLVSFRAQSLYLKSEYILSLSLKHILFVPINTNQILKKVGTLNKL